MAAAIANIDSKPVAAAEISLALSAAGAQVLGHSKRGAQSDASSDSTSTGGESGRTEERASLMPSVSSMSTNCIRSLWHTIQDPSGSRQVQASLAAASTEAERCAIASALKGCFKRAARCAHANHVVQRCINTMEPQSLQPIIDELLERESCLQLAKHRYASRVMQHLIRKCRADQLKALIEVLLAGVAEVALHPIGCTTMRQVMMSGTKEQQYRLIRFLELNAAEVASTNNGSHLLVCALAHADAHDKVWLARAFVQDPATLAALAERKNGRSPMPALLAALPASERSSAEASLARTSRNSRAAKKGVLSI